jgi:hypothetical protein
VNNQQTVGQFALDSMKIKLNGSLKSKARISEKHQDQPAQTREPTSDEQWSSLQTQHSEYYDDLRDILRVFGNPQKIQIEVDGEYRTIQL